MVYAMDENVGRLLDKLEETGLAENTVVIFTSDNGGLSTLASNRNVAPTSVRPLRAGKGWLYEGGIRVPLIIRAPGVTSPGESDVPVVSHDLYPTILSLAGLPPQPEERFDGQNLRPVLGNSGSLNRATLYWHYPHYHGSAWKPGAAIRAGDWKLVEFYEEAKVELYNLKDDLGEQNDLAEAYPEKAAELQRQLKQWQEETGAKLPEQNPSFTPED
jgi:arylsulfatase A-like enzyme